MNHRQAKVPPEDLEFLSQYDRSIDHWSKQIVKALIQVDDMKGTVRTLYLARQRVFEKAYAEAGIDHAKVQHAELKEDGTLNVLLREDAAAETASEPASPNGAPQ